MPTLTLYHGTTAEHAQAILTDGLRAGTCLTSREDIAEYYAECAVDEATDEGRDTHEVILAITVERDQLCVDYPAYEEPLTYYRDEFVSSDEEWHTGLEDGSIPYPDNDNDVDTALSVTACVKTTSKIPASAITTQE